MSARHFLSLLDLDSATLLRLLDRASELKRLHAEAPDSAPRPLTGRVLAMIFEKASTRTRVSFEAGMTHLGGAAMFLSSQDTQLGRGEPLSDTATVLSRMVDAVMIRARSHETVASFAAHASVPVINGLTDRFHPCQLLADMQTYREHRGELRGITVAWVGDGNNVCQSYVNAAARFGFRLRVATPAGYEPDPEVVRASGAEPLLTADPEEAVSGADLVVTDVWASMGQEDEQGDRERAFAGFQVDERLMSRASARALFMHCLPAHRGEEVSAGVLDGPQSVVWDEAENRLHAQKALLELLVHGSRHASTG